MNRFKASAYRFLIFSAAVLSASEGFSEDWKPVEGQLMTRWAKEVSVDNPLPEYPRPQLRRANWKNLNGLWDYALTAKDGSKPETFDGKILVPFPIESALSDFRRF